MGPTAICDTCGTPAWECASAGLICHRCKTGVFMQRKFWTYIPCPDCTPGDRSVCPSCNGAGVIATPRDEVTVEDLREEYAKLADRYQWQRYAVPVEIAERLRYVEAQPPR